MSYEPKIIGFLCNWCSYAGADLAGVSRFQYPTNIRIVKVMCSGRVDPSFIFELFIQGIDGILFTGCHLGDCHYQKGNYYAERRIKVIRKLLSKAGFDLRRFEHEWVSASEGQRFSQVVSSFTKTLKELGKSPLSGEEVNLELMENMFIAKNVVSDFRLTALVNRQIDLVEKGNVYGNKLKEEDLEKLIDKVIEDEFARGKILFSTREPISVKNIAQKIKLPEDKVLEHVVTLKDRGLISLSKIEEQTPLYVSEEVI